MNNIGILEGDNFDQMKRVVSFRVKKRLNESKLTEKEVFDALIRELDDEGVMMMGGAKFVGSLELAKIKNKITFNLASVYAGYESGTPSVGDMITDILHEMQAMGYRLMSGRIFVS